MALRLSCVKTTFCDFMCSSWRRHVCWTHMSCENMEVWSLRYLNFGVDGSSSSKTVCFLAPWIRVSTWRNNRKPWYDHYSSIGHIGASILRLLILHIIQKPCLHCICNESFPRIRIQSPKTLLNSHNIIVFKTMNDINQPLILVAWRICTRCCDNYPWDHL